MIPFQTAYPKFEANQVLTNEHLNTLFDYLDEQGRLTRTNLIGTGIVCGLEATLSGNNIQISKGCGITSEGYLIIEPTDITLVSRKPYFLPSELDYPLFRQADLQQYQLWEVLSEREPNDTLLGNDGFQLNDYALLLFLELRKDSLRNCTPNNCNDKGWEVTATVRRLLISREDLSNFEQGYTSPDNASGVQPTAFKVMRPKFSSNQYDYAAAIQNTIPGLQTALNDMYSKYGEPGLINPFEGFTTQFTAANASQYQYDYLIDVIQAYNELVCFVEQNPLCDCVPHKNFPRHLVVQQFGDAPPLYRHIFVPSKALCQYDLSQQTIALDKAKKLYDRLKGVVGAFTIPSDSNLIKITPTQYGDVPLGHKAIPIYYNLEAVKNLWAVGKACSSLAPEVNGYHFTSTPLDYHLEGYNFFRIEGQIGSKASESVTQIKDQIVKADIPIRVYEVDKRFLPELVQQHPGITHGAGAPKGGTFIVETADGKITNDYFLPYYIENDYVTKMWLFRFIVGVCLLTALYVLLCCILNVRRGKDCCDRIGFTEQVSHINAEPEGRAVFAFYQTTPDTKPYVGIKRFIPCFSNPCFYLLLIILALIVIVAWLYLTPRGQVVLRRINIRY